jgi:hypothetical protein
MLLVHVLALGLFACQPPTDSCLIAATLDPVALDEVGEPGFAAIDGLIPAGTYRVRDGGYDLVVTLTWDDEASPRRYEWNDGDGDGVVPDVACEMDYEVRGTLEVDSGDGRYDERGSALTAATVSGGGSLWVIIDDRDVRGDEVPGKELWLEVFRFEDELRFGLTAIDFGSDADYLVDAVMEPI